MNDCVPASPAPRRLADSESTAAQNLRGQCRGRAGKTGRNPQTRAAERTRMGVATVQPARRVARGLRPHARCRAGGRSDSIPCFRLPRGGAASPFGVRAARQGLPKSPGSGVYSAVLAVIFHARSDTKKKGTDTKKKGTAVSSDFSFDNIYNDEDRVFFAELSREDDLGLILRAHMHCERVLIRLADKHIPKLQQPKNLRFITAVHALAGTGTIDPNTRDRMVWLNETRNRLAHEVEFELTVADFDALMAASGIAGRRSINKVNAHERPPHTARHLISNALFIWRNNLCYIEDKGVAAHEEVRRWQEHQARVFENWEESPYDPDLD
jgi:hypothetical protein